MLRCARLPVPLLAALAVATSACSDRVGQGWDWERMRSQPRYNGYGASAFFRDGKVMQAPPPGTMPHEALGERARETAARAAAASPSAELLRRGADRFHIFCAVCHGERGDGRSNVAANMDPPRPPSLLTAPMRELSSDSLHAVITRGSGRMPSYAPDLSVADRWAVEAYVRSLQLRQPEAPGDSGAGARP